MATLSESKPNRCHFFNNISSLPVSVLRFLNAYNIQTFPLLLCFYGDLWSVTFNVTIITVLGHHKPTPYMYNATDVVFMPDNTAFILQPVDRGVILNFEYYIRNIFCKAVLLP